MCLQSKREASRGLQKRRYFFSETFAAIGCAEYYKATGDKEALSKAEKYYDIAYGCMKGTIKTGPKINPETRRMKSHSPAMIMLSTSQEMRSIPEISGKYAPKADEFLNELINGRFLTEHGFTHAEKKHSMSIKRQANLR